MRASAPLVAIFGLVLGLVATAPLASAAEKGGGGDNKPLEVVNHLKPDDIAGVLRDAGFRAELLKQNNRWRIHTGMGGRKITVYLYCDESGACDSLTYSLGFTASSDFTLAMANKWNRDKRYAKAYIDTDGGMVMEYDLSFSGGVTRDTVAESARLFDRLVSMFDQAISSSN